MNVWHQQALCFRLRVEIIFTNISVKLVATSEFKVDFLPFPEHKIFFPLLKIGEIS